MIKVLMLAINVRQHPPVIFLYANLCFHQYMYMNKILLKSLAPSSHWEFSMNKLKVNLNRAPKMSTIFWSQ